MTQEELKRQALIELERRKMERGQQEISRYDNRADAEALIDRVDQIEAELQTTEDPTERLRLEAEFELAAREAETILKSDAEDNTWWEDFTETRLGQQLGESVAAGKEVWATIPPEYRAAIATIAGTEGLRNKVLRRLVMNPYTALAGLAGSIGFAGYQLATNDEERDKFNQAVTGRNEWPRKARPTN